MIDVPLVKIDGFQRREDVVLAEELGADFLGVILSEGFSRSVAPAAAAALLEGVTLPTVAVLVNETVVGAIEAASAISASVVQLHGDEPRTVVRELYERDEWRLWKAVRARSHEDIVRAVEAYADIVDGFLVEGWREGVYGGGGVELALDPAQVRSTLPEGLQFVLAGGLTPYNLTEAIARFRPDVVDVSSGVESSPGGKDPELLRSFVSTAKNVDRAADRRGTDR